MLRVGLIKHHCPFRAVAAAVSGTHIIAHLQFLPFLSERSSVGRFGEVNERRLGVFGSNPTVATRCFDSLMRLRSKFGAAKRMRLPSGEELNLFGISGPVANLCGLKHLALLMINPSHVFSYYAGPFKSLKPATNRSYV